MRVVLKDVGVPAWTWESPNERGAVLPLALECARVLLQVYGDPENLVDVAAYVPAHVRRDLARWAAIQRPLSSAKLYALGGDDGHMDGELIIVGPQASLRGDILRPKDTERERRQYEFKTGGDSDWDSDGSGSWVNDADWDAVPSDSSLPLMRLALVRTT